MKHAIFFYMSANTLGSITNMWWDESSHIIRDRSRISGKGVQMYKGVGVRFADFIALSFLHFP